MLILQKYRNCLQPVLVLLETVIVMNTIGKHWSIIVIRNVPEYVILVTFAIIIIIIIVMFYLVRCDSYQGVWETL